MLVTYVPEGTVEQVKRALFDAGAGRIGNYSECCFSLKGQGQFLANEGANPAIGELHVPSYVDEIRLEMVLEKACVKAVINALKASHPYEEPAYHLLNTVDVETL